MTESIYNTTVRMIPEVCMAAIASRAVPELVCWTVLRHADSEGNSGTGRVQRSRAVRYLADHLELSPRRVRQIIAGGMGTFWRAGRGDRLYLIGILRLCDLLGVKVLVSRYALVSYSIMADALSKTKPLISTIAACTFRHPTAVDYIAGACGVSGRTVQRHLAESNDMLIVTRNLLILHQCRDRLEAEASRDAALEAGEHPAGSIDIKITADGILCVVREMPNTYNIVTGRMSYGRLRYRLKRRRGVVETKPERDTEFHRPDIDYKRSGIMHLGEMSGYTGRVEEPTEVWSPR